MKHIAALVSGGVDSTVSVHRFVSQYPSLKKYVHIYYLKIWLEDELSFLGSCPWEEDLYYVERVADSLCIPYTVLSLQQEYHEKIISYTLDELRIGGTPNPDIFCNSLIKMGAFLEKIQEADIVITGHYSRSYQDANGKARLFCASDRVKDQSYFLSMLSKEQLAKLVMPLGDMKKEEVRSYAKLHNLVPMDRKDSQGLCFLGKIKYRDFVKFHLGTKKGVIIDIQSNTVLGDHDGTWFYTIGQRSGLGLGGGPWYVAKKSFDENIVWVCHVDVSEARASNRVPFRRLHWIGDDTTCHDIQYVKIRHGPELIPAQCNYTINDISSCTQSRVVRDGKDIDSNQEVSIVKLAQSDYGIADGQYVVFYRHITTVPHILHMSSNNSSSFVHIGWGDLFYTDKNATVAMLYECLGLARICVEQGNV